MTASTIAVAAVSAHDVCVAVEDVLRNHLSAALVARAGARSLELPEPKAYQQVSNPRIIRDDQAPIIDVSSPGLGEQGVQLLSGKWVAHWSVIVTVYLRGTSYSTVAETVREYTSVLRSVLFADPHPFLGGLASARSWVDEDYDAVDNINGRTLGGGAVEFEYRIDNAANPNA